jgi:Flp pilus assembly protein TadB
VSAAALAHAAFAAAPVRRLCGCAARPGDAALSARALLLAPRSGSVRLLMAVARGGRVGSALAAVRVLATLAGALGCLAATVVGGPQLLIAALPVCWGGVCVPGLAVGHAARQGAAAAAAALPLALELVAAALRAGLPIDRALAVAAGCVHPSLATLLSRASAASAGGGSVAAALGEAAETSGVDGLATVAALIDRRQRLGLPLAPQLLAVAGTARARARAETLARAARRGPLASLITATVVAPACALGLLCVVLAGLLTDGRLLGLG